MADTVFHPSIEGAQHGAKSLGNFLDYARVSGAKGAQPSNYMLETGEKDTLQGPQKPAMCPKADLRPRIRIDLNENLHAYEVRERLRVTAGNSVFYRWAFGFLLIMNALSIFLQGFHLYGFHLSDSVILSELSCLFAMWMWLRSKFP